MARLKIDGVYYNVERSGLAGGEPLMLLHGFSGSAATWAGVGPNLGVRREIIAVDLLGHGNSGAPADPARYRMERAVDDLAGIAGMLGVERMVLAGYSMGGRVALAFAAKHSRFLSALVLESASPGLDGEAERAARAAADNALAGRIEREGIESFARWWPLQPIFASQRNLPRPVRDLLHAQRLGNSPTGLANSLRGLGVGAQASLWPALGELSIPTLLIVGELDAKYRAIAKRMAAAMSRARMAMIPGAGHAVHIECPAGFERAVLEFLDGLPKRADSCRQ